MITLKKNDVEIITNLPQNYWALESMSTIRIWVNSNIWRKAWHYTTNRIWPVIGDMQLRIRGLRNTDV